MKKVTLFIGLLLSSHTFACGYNDGACEQAEEMVKIQKQMLDEQRRANGQAELDAMHQRIQNNHVFENIGRR